MLGKKKRITFILGAGAVIDWDAPTTLELTKLVRNSGFQCVINTQTKIAESIYQAILDKGHSSKNVNFETIINAIEELLIYYSYFDNKSKTPSLAKIFFKSNFEKDYLNYSISGDGIEKHNYRIDIPIGLKYDYLHSGVINGESPPQIFLQQLLAEILTNINARVARYAYHSKGHSKIDSESNNEINLMFNNWVQKLNPLNSILRVYTLNYDSLFKVLFLKFGVDEVFEGFEIDYEEENGQFSRPNVVRIVEDINSHCYYNLHGSAFWAVSSRDDTKLVNPEILLKGYPEFQINQYEQVCIQVEKGKNVLFSNIITGYQKAQKGFITPFKQMQASFDRDCLSTDELYIIGYSFGDEHINMSIKTALKYNPNIKIILIDPLYLENENYNGYDKLQETFINVFSNYFNAPFTSELRNNNCWHYFNSRLIVYTMTMKEFLETQI